MNNDPRTPFAQVSTYLLGAAFFFSAAFSSPAPLSAATASGPLLTPLVREIHPGSLQPVRRARFEIPDANDEDIFAASNLAEAFKERGISAGADADTIKPDLIVRLLRVDSIKARELLKAEHLAFDPAMNDEGYVLISRPGVATIIAKSAAGVFYGAQTLKQMIQIDNGVPALWTATIRDWPAMKYRGIDDDLSRGPLPTFAFLKHQLEVFAAHKVNLYSPYFEHTLKYSTDPLPAPPDGSLSRSEAQELANYGRELHVMVVPEQEAFGHLHHVLQYEKYADLAETPHGHVIAPGQAGSQPLILSWFTQISQDFPSPFLHIGADETFELGTGRTKPDVDKRGLGPVYADFLSTIHSTLAPLNHRLLFWGDVAWNDPAAVSQIPKDMIAIPWVYWHEDSYDKNILPFKSAGMETWVAPGDANWNVVYPLGASALDNIAGFVESGQRLGSTGELTTVWNDDGEGLFNEDWFGVLFGAAAGWQPAKSDAAAYQSAFGQTFFGDSTGQIDAAERELIAAEGLIDVSDVAFWIDPWSVEGQKFSKRLQDRIPAARLHAEHAVELLEAARTANPHLREPHAIDAMELGARRIDFIGEKFQLAAEMSEAYAKAYALRNDKSHSTEARELLYSISSMNGRCQDLRDNYSMLKNLYQTSWLAENRPYWLDNVLVRYNLRIDLWQKRADDFDSIIRVWQSTGELPTQQEAGLPVLPQ